MSNQYHKDSYYDKCAYNQCKNGKFLHGKRLFRFPLPGTRCDMWIQNAGNMALKDLSVNTLRKLGLCEDHFLPTAFTSATKERLRTDAIPIAHEDYSGASTSTEKDTGASTSTEKNTGASTSTEKDTGASTSTEKDTGASTSIESELVGKIQNVPVAQENIGLLLNDENEMGKKQRNDSTKHSLSDEDIENQTSAQCTLQTYRPATLNFDKTEQEDTMDWLYLEPLTDKNYNYIEGKNKEKINSNAKIKALRNENFKLRQKIKDLEFQMQRMALKCKCKQLNKKITKNRHQKQATTKRKY
ncbi:hypothetical protein PUN28_020756 [Cardiocondyla obscurior]|uniref:THAP-type domain-containing protein n=1 Tax=Cardiocondyla obscurior TaxID=286306 RepID=A0AAW2E8U7_9HYME